jgi:hypothetical protein
MNRSLDVRARKKGAESDRKSQRVRSLSQTCWCLSVSLTGS